MISLVAFLVAAPSAASTLDASARAHAALRKFHVLATVETRAGGKRTQVKYDIVADGDDVLIRIQEAATKGRARSDRTFLFNRTRVVAYDAVARERLTRPVPPEAKRLGRLIFTVGPVDDLVRFLLDGSQMGTFYENFRKLTNWKVASGKDGVNLTRDVRVGGGRNHASMRFAPRTNLLTAFDLETSDSATRWQIRYAPVSHPSLTMPADTRSVTSFTVAPEPPKFASREAERLAKSMLRAYGGLRRAVVSVRDNTGSSRVTLDGDRVREDGPYGFYAFDGKTLSIVDRRRKVVYQGKTSRKLVPSEVAAAKGRLDPLTRQILLGKTPLQELMVPEMTVATSGTVEMMGVTCDILRFDTSRIRVTLCVRRRDHLLDSASTNTLDGHGRPVSTTFRRFTYISKGKSQPASTFAVAVPAGYRVLPLPKIGR